MLNLGRPLIMGAGGFIGHHLAQELANLQSTEIVYCVDLKDSKRLENLKDLKKIKIIEADLSLEQNYSALPADVTSVFALAAMNGTGRFYEKPFTVLESSILPTIFTIKKFASVCPILYTSSSEVYASTVSNFNAAVPTPESVIPSIEDIHNPRWSYGAAKLLGEVAANAAAVEYGAQTVIIRYHNVYGPDMGQDHFIPDFIGRARNGVFQITGAEESRSFLHISDAVQGTIQALSRAGTDSPIYHLGSDEEFLIMEAAEMIIKLMGLQGAEIQELPAKPGSVARRQADSSRAFEDFGWKAKVKFEEGIQMYLGM